MATITTTAPLYRYRATLTAPFAHGAGNAGNTRLLRTQDVVLPDGTAARVPFLSAGSIRHGLRDALAWHMADTLHLDGALTKAGVDLLWSGGAVTSTGAQVDLDMQRRVDELLPGLSMMGYAARSDIHEGTLRVSDAILVCAENGWRLDPDTAALRPKRAAAYRGEEFGTRHDTASTMAARMIASPDTLDAPAVTTTQMIYDTQVLVSGAMLAGSITLTPAATDTHRRVLLATLGLWAPNGHVRLGASTATGYGAADIEWLTDTTGQAEAIDWLTSHTRDNAEAITALIAEVSA